MNDWKASRDLICASHCGTSWSDVVCAAGMALNLPTIPAATFRLMSPFVPAEPKLSRSLATVPLSVPYGCLLLLPHLKGVDWQTIALPDR